MRWLLTILVLLVLALTLRLGFVAYVLYALVGGAILSRWLTKTWTASFVATRDVSQLTAEVGQTVSVIVTARNTGRWPIVWLLVEELLPRSALIFDPPQLTLKGRRIGMFTLRAGAGQTLLYQLTCNRRGYYALGPTLCETGDLFGLHRRFLVTTPPVYLTVYPDVVSLAGYDVSSKRPVGEVVVTHRLFEDPTRIAGVREYQAGDPLNRVHWRATARTGTLHSKIYEPSTVAGATILLDFHQDSFEKRHEPVRSELAITAVASLANALYLAGQQVGLVTNGRDAADEIREAKQRADVERTRQAARAETETQLENTRLRPVCVETRRGPDQFMQIVEGLARLKLTDGLRFEQLIGETASRLPRDATVIAILTQVTAKAAITLGSLRRQGFSVTAAVNVFDEEDFATAAGLLMSEGILPRQLKDRDGIAELCRNTFLGSK